MREVDRLFLVFIDLNVPALGPQVQVQVILRPTVSRPVRLGVGPLIFENFLRKICHTKSWGLA
jgi:hypothetical protein